MMPRSLPATVRLVTAAAFLAAILPGLARAGTSDAAAPQVAQAAPVQPKKTVQQKAQARADRVEERIASLHQKLRITPAQEEQWKSVAQVMRDNATSMVTLTSQRSGNTAMSAVDDLKSYEQISEAHTEGLKKFIPAFETLYASMSDDQKKNADVVFSRAQRHAVKKGKS